MKNFDEILAEMERQYRDENSKIAHSFSEGMVFALETIGKLSKEQALFFRSKNDQLRFEHRFDDRDE